MSESFINKNLFVLTKESKSQIWNEMSKILYSGQNKSLLNLKSNQADDGQLAEMADEALVNFFEGIYKQGNIYSNLRYFYKIISGKDLEVSDMAFCREIVLEINKHSSLLREEINRRKSKIEGINNGR